MELNADVEPALSNGSPEVKGLNFEHAVHESGPRCALLKWRVGAGHVSGCFLESCLLLALIVQWLRSSVDRSSADHSSAAIEVLRRHTAFLIAAALSSPLHSYLRCSGHVQTHLCWMVICGKLLSIMTESTHQTSQPCKASDHANRTAALEVMTCKGPPSR